MANLKTSGDARVLVVSTPPGFTSKWLAPRLYRFSTAHPEIDVRISSSMNNANFTTDSVDAAIRNLPVGPLLPGSRMRILGIHRVPQRGDDRHRPKASERARVE